MIPKNYAQVELKKKNRNITGNGGLCWMDKSLEFAGFWKDIKKLSKPKNSNNELSAEQKIRGEILSRTSGATAIDDLEVLRKDKGFEKLTGKKIVSPDTVMNFIADNRTKSLLKKVNKVLILKALKASELRAFTYDNDATYFESSKESAKFSYRDTKDFSGLLGFIPELNLCATLDLRPGNISPRDGILKQIKEMFQICKKVKKKIKMVRLDSAGHNNNIFNFCNEKGLDFYITLAKNAAIKENIAHLSEAQWTKLNKKYNDNKTREYAEFIYASNDENCESMRAVVIRWRNQKQLELFKNKYCYHVMGTNNLEQSSEEILEIHAGRMGSEN